MKRLCKFTAFLLCACLLLCGSGTAFAACNHDNVDMLDRHTYTQIPGNSQYHNMITWMNWYCHDCNTYPWPEERWMTNETEHVFSGNTCYLCGYTKACSHSSTWPRIDFSVGGKKDDKLHYILGTGWQECSDCGAHLESIYMEQDAPHEFVNGVCECGYRQNNSASSCSHSSTKQVTGTKSYEWIAGNDSYHNVITPYSTMCSACGKTITSDQKKETALHSFSGNQCSVCGYRKSAGTTSSGTNSTSTNFSPASSSASDSYRQCPSCGWKTDNNKAKFCGFCSTELVNGGSYLNIQADIGDIISFGQYEQDGNLSNGKEKIEWLVLDKQGGKARVVSRYALDYRAYNKAWKELTWETAPMREWLNRDFINTAFTAAEQEMIPTVTVPADRNPDYRTNTGNDTQDQIFLLSIVEVNRYFSSDSAMKCKPTAYAKKQGVATNSDGYCWWWLRTAGYNAFDNAYVNRHGGINTGGHFESIKDFAVRPAMWINLVP